MRATGLVRYDPRAYGRSKFVNIFGRQVPRLGDEAEEIRPDSYPESTFSVQQLSGVTDWVSGVWDLLTGKPQSWYTHLDLDQKALAVRAAEVNAIGETLWNMTRDAYLAQTQGPDIEFLSFSDINNGIDQAIKSLIVTKDHVPSDQEIASAEDFNAQYGRYVDFVKSMVPEVSAQVKTDSDNVKAALGTGTMKSPASTGRQEFVDEMERRAKILAAGVGLGALAYLAIPMILMAIMSGGRK